jgi:hypothetical protein
MFLRIIERPMGVEPTTDWVGADALTATDRAELMA